MDGWIDWLIDLLMYNWFSVRLVDRLIDWFCSHRNLSTYGYVPFFVNVGRWRIWWRTMRSSCGNITRLCMKWNAHGSPTIEPVRECWNWINAVGMCLTPFSKSAKISGRSSRWLRNGGPWKRAIMSRTPRSTCCAARKRFSWVRA